MKSLVIAIILLMTSILASATPIDWTVATSAPSGKITFTVLPETIAVNSTQSVWKVNVTIEQGTTSDSALVMVTGCKVLHGFTVLVLLADVENKIKNESFIPWKIAGDSVADKVAGLACGAALKANLVLSRSETL